MTPYHYPYEDFDRDFGAILPSPHAVAGEFEQAVGAIHCYIQRQYSDPLDRLERGAALMQVVFYLQAHLEDFEDAGLAVCGATQALVRKHVIRAIHELMVEKAFQDTETGTTPSDVIALALRAPAPASMK
jgi:hypothetical protein